MLEQITQKTLDSLWKRFTRSIESEAAESFLEILLRLMQAVLFFSAGFRENVAGFSGKYQFISKDAGITVAAVFENGRLKVKEKILPDPNVTVRFRNGRALFNFLFSPNQDVLGAMLRHDVETEGNLNFLYRFGYLAKRLQLMMPRP